MINASVSMYLWNTTRFRIIFHDLCNCARSNNFQLVTRFLNTFDVPVATWFLIGIASQEKKEIYIYINRRLEPLLQNVAPRECNYQMKKTCPLYIFMRLLYVSLLFFLFYLFKFLSRDSFSTNDLVFLIV